MEEMGKRCGGGIGLWEVNSFYLFCWGGGEIFTGWRTSCGGRLEGK